MKKINILFSTFFLFAAGRLQASAFGYKQLNKAIDFVPDSILMPYIGIISVGIFISLSYLLIQYMTNQSVSVKEALKQKIGIVVLLLIASLAFKPILKSINYVLENVPVKATKMLSKGIIDRLKNDRIKSLADALAALEKKGVELESKEKKEDKNLIGKGFDVIAGLKDAAFAWGKGKVEYIVYTLFSMASTTAILGIKMTRFVLLIAIAVLLPISFFFSALTFKYTFLKRLVFIYISIYLWEAVFHAIDASLFLLISQGEGLTDIFSEATSEAFFSGKFIVLAVGKAFMAISASLYLSAPIICSWAFGVSQDGPVAGAAMSGLSGIGINSPMRGGGKKTGP